MATSVRIGQKVHRLIALAEELTGNIEPLTGYCYQLLDTEPSSSVFVNGASCLNNDSVPLQLCVTASPKEASLRIIGDPGAFHQDTEQRFHSSMDTLYRLIEQTGSGSLKTAAEKTIHALIPQEAEERMGYKQGFVWIGTKPNQPGIAFYLEMAPLGHNKSWQAVEHWLQSILPFADEALATMKHISQYCTVASAGLEGSSPENTRAKIYFRFNKHTSLDNLDMAIFSSDEMKEFIALAKGDFEVDLQGTVMSIGFHLSSGKLADAKIDLCGHCIRHSQQTWRAVIDQITNRFSLAAIDTAAILDSGEYEVAFIGFGLTEDNKPRLNLYIKYNIQKGHPESDEITSALRDAIGYLASVQHTNGSWSDYHLPVGESDQWVTAYAAHSLALYGKKTNNKPAIDAAMQAANWLAEQRSYHAGWGYNGMTGPDADSTAMAIALFDELGIRVADADRSFLREHWQQGNCIATYSGGPGAWGEGHWDVTPWSYHGMRQEDREVFYDQFVSALENHRMDNGYWRTYWWKNPYYSTFVTLEILDILGIPEPEHTTTQLAGSIQIDNPFDLGCCVGIECIRNPSDNRIGSYIRSLLNWQFYNGQWSGAPNLRVTDNTCYTPWDKPSGSYYEDKKSIITTATIIRVLSKVIPSKGAQQGEMNYHWI